MRRRLSPEHRQKMGAALRRYHADRRARGERMSPEQREKLRNATKGWWDGLSPERREQERARLQRQADARRCVPYTGKPNGRPRGYKQMSKPQMPGWAIRRYRSLCIEVGVEHWDDIKRAFAASALRGEPWAIALIVRAFDDVQKNESTKSSLTDLDELSNEELADRAEALAARLRGNGHALGSVIDVEPVDDDNKSVEQLQAEAEQAQREFEVAQREAEAAQQKWMQLQVQR